MVGKYEIQFQCMVSVRDLLKIMWHRIEDARCTIHSNGLAIRTANQIGVTYKIVETVVIRLCSLAHISQCRILHVISRQV